MAKFFFIAYLLLTMFLLGCTSQEEKLSQELILVSKETDALLEERKALINLQGSAQNVLDSMQKYEKQKQVYLEVRNQNDAQGLPTGPSVNTGEDFKQQVIDIEKADNWLSDELAKLKQKKGKLIEEQGKIN